MSFSLIFKNSGWLVTGKCLTLGASFASMAVVARFYGPSSFGALSLALSVVALMAPIIQLGLNSIVTRDLVNTPERRNEILGTVLFMRGLGTIVSIAIIVSILIFGFFKRNQAGIYVPILLIGEFAKIGLVFSFWFNSRTQGRVVALCEAGATLVASVLRILFSVMAFDFMYIVYSQALEGAFIGISYAIVYKKLVNPLNCLKVSFSLAMSYIRDCAPLIASSATAVIYQKIDQVMIAYYMNNTAVGVYAVASRISEVWYFVPTLISVSAFPTILLAKNKSSQEYDAYLQKLFDYLFILGLFAAVMITLIAPYFIKIVFGASYSMSASILVVHVWGGIFISMRALVSKWILAENILRYSLISQGAGAVINVFLNWLLIPHYGMIGAAIATLIAYASAGYLIFSISNDTRKIFKMMSKSLFMLGLWGRLMRRSVAI